MREVCLWQFYLLATSTVIAGWVQTCDSAGSCRFVTVRIHGDFKVVAPLGDQAASTITWFPIQSHYPDAEITIHILVMSSARLGSDKYQFCKSLVWLDWDSNSLPSLHEACILPSWPPHLAMWWQNEGLLLWEYRYSEFVSAGSSGSTDSLSPSAILSNLKYLLWHFHWISFETYQVCHLAKMWL